MAQFALMILLLEMLFYTDKSKKTDVEGNNYTLEASMLFVVMLVLDLAAMVGIHTPWLDGLFNHTMVKNRKTTR